MRIDYGNIHKIFRAFLKFQPYKADQAGHCRPPREYLNELRSPNLLI